MRAASLYARYSSDQQREASIADQLRLCRQRAEREGYEVVQEYTDAAISGASLDRPGIRSLLADAKRRKFDVVIAEDLSRLSRDQEDVAGLFKRLRFVGVSIVTVSEGEINELHVGLKGTMNALYLRDLAQKTHRGLVGRVKAGRSGGGKPYGYDPVREIDADGKLTTGLLRINSAQAAVVRRIFTEFADGRSALQIANGLNEDGIAPPRPSARKNKGRAAGWAHTTILGSASNESGILRNRLYAGVRTFDKTKWEKDPDTRRRVARPNPTSTWLVEDVPELRIIDDALWEAVQAQLGRQAERGANVRKALKGRHSLGGPRPKRLFSGFLRCACCGGQYTLEGERYRCSTNKTRGAAQCSNRVTVGRDDLEGRLIAALPNLFDPESLAAFKADLRRLAERKRSGADDGTELRQQLAEVERDMGRLADAILQGVLLDTLTAKAAELERRKATLTKRLAATADPADGIEDALPAAADDLSALVRGVVERAPRELSKARQLIGKLIGERIEIHPTPRGGLEATLAGDFTGLLALLADQKGTRARAAEQRWLEERAIYWQEYEELGAVDDGHVTVVAGAGFEPATFRL